MKKNKIISIVIRIIVCLLPMVAGILLYSSLPDTMRVNFGGVFNFGSNVPKNFVLFGFPVMMAFIQMAVSFALWSKLKDESNVPILLVIVEWIIPVVTVFVYYILILYALDNTVNVWKSTCLLVAMLLCILGNYFTKMSYESSKKFMYPKPKDEMEFRKMTKVGGYTLIGVGIVLLVVTLVL